MWLLEKNRIIGSMRFFSGGGGLKMKYENNMYIYFIEIYTLFAKYFKTVV